MSEALCEFRPQVGERYIGWGKTWRVVHVWKNAKVAEIVNEGDSRNTVRLSFEQFKSMERDDARG